MLKKHSALMFPECVIDLFCIATRTLSRLYLTVVRQVVADWEEGGLQQKEDFSMLIEDTVGNGFLAPPHPSFP